MSWLGLDVGGANVKAADGRGWARSLPFPLWKDPAGLAAALSELIHGAPSTRRIAVTMTGELCDCFATKAEGVRHILSAVEAVAAGREVFVYLVDGRLTSTAEARDVPHLAAASNWHALARYVGRMMGRGTGLLIDIGSTTTDVIPIGNGDPCASGRNDTDRLLAGELVYTGVGRTPLCAVVQWLPWRGQQCPVAAELFATVADAYVILDCIAERNDATATADGRPLAKEFAAARMARMICADSSTFNVADARLAAEHVRDVQLATLDHGARQVTARQVRPLQWLMVSGAGEFLARQMAARLQPAGPIHSLSRLLGPQVSVAAPAHAVAVLAAAEMGD